MQKNKQIGFLVEELSSSQLSFNLIKNINNYLQGSNDDFVVFFENSTSSVLSPNFSLMSVNEIWSFEGSLIATSVSTAISMRKCFSPKNKLFYVWDLEWTRQNGKNFEFTIQAFTDPNIKLIARSEEHAKAIKNYCNRDVNDIVSDFNLEKIVRIINE